MALSIVVPWRTEPSRVGPHEFVTTWWRGHFPNAEMIDADSGHEPFNRAASRNCGVKQAAGDVVVVCDADTIASPDAVTSAIEASADGRLHFGYDRYGYLSQQDTETLMRGELVDPALAGLHNSGVLVMTPDAWWSAGGQDETFIGWGGEDDAFHAACDALLGPSQWHPGWAYSLWHESASRIGQSEWIPNRDRAARYINARTDSGAVLRLLGER